MNSCGYDLMCLGNHEFNRGDDQIKTYESMAEFPMVSASVTMKDTGELRFTPNKMFELTGGTLVGVFGLTTPETLLTTKPVNVEPFAFLTGEDLYQCAQSQVDDLRAEGADLVICLGHLGNEAKNASSTSKDVLSNVKGIDLFIDGHDHELVEEEVAGTLLVETGCWMRNIGLVLIDAGVPSSKSVAYKEFEGIDEGTQAVIDTAKERVDTQFGVVPAATDFKLDAERPGVRRHETNLGDLLCDALIFDAEASTGEHVDATIFNADGIRSSIDAGDITLEDVKTVPPHSNQLCMVKITGTQMLEILEAACQAVGTDTELSAFPQVGGIEFTVNGTVAYEQGEPYPDTTYASPAAPGARVTIHTVGGSDFDENATYTVVITDFLTQGGDTYYQFKVAAEKEQPVMCAYDYEALVGYLIGPFDHKVDEHYKEPQGRITIIEEWHRVPT